MDFREKNKFLIGLSESERTDFGRREFADQSDTQRVFSAIGALESQVNNGGFLQYFESWDGDTASFAPIALQRIGAHACARIVEQALAAVSEHPLPVDHGARGQLLEKLGDHAQAQLAALDSEFMDYPDNLTELLFEFVRSHPDVFGPTPS
jgi:hypothetical protein